MPAEPVISPAEAATLRPATPADAAFLFRLYAESRTDEMKLTGWPRARQQIFLRDQFAARGAHYTAAFPEAHSSIVLWRGRPAGQLTVNRTDDEIRLADIALAPECRGRGLGRRLMLTLIDEARAGKKPLRLQVAKNNPARQLYLRLGFAPIGETGFHLQMEWRAQ